MNTNDDSLERIEIKIAYLERANVELSDVVFRQHREIQALQASLAQVLQRLPPAGADEPPRSLEDERPPHY